MRYKKLDIAVMQKQAFDYLNKIDLIPYLLSHISLSEVIYALRVEYEKKYLEETKQFLFDAINQDDFYFYIMSRYKNDPVYAVNLNEYTDHYITVYKKEDYKNNESKEKRKDNKN